MRQKRIEVAMGVARSLFAAEQALDVAASRIAELNARLPAARLEADLSAIIGQDAFESSTDALVHLAKARRRIVSTHQRLKGASDMIGLEAVSFGDSVKPPKSSDVTQPLLRVAS